MTRILFYDLEVSPNLGYAYGMWDTRILKIKEYASIMSISWSWGDRDENEELIIHHASLANIPTKRGTSPNKALALLIHSLFNEADIVLAHNAYRFDNKVATAAFIYHKLAPPAPYKTIDTLRVARSVGKFPGGNSLDELAKYLGVGRKSDVTIKDIWFDCLRGDAKAWKLMEIYNNNDVQLLYDVYMALRPWMTNHPNLGDLNQVDGVCPKCGSDKLRSYGSAPRRNGRVQTYICGSCGGRCAESKINKKGRIVNGV